MTIEQRIAEGLRGLPGARRRQVESELLAHVADLRRELYAEGLEPEVVEQRVLDRFGDPADVCRRLAHVHKPGLTWGRALLIFASAMVLAGLAVKFQDLYLVHYGRSADLSRSILRSMYLGFWLIAGLWAGQESIRPWRDGLRALAVYVIAGFIPSELSSAVTWVWMFPFLPYNWRHISNQSIRLTAPVIIGLCFFAGYLIGRLVQRHKRIFI